MPACPAARVLWRGLAGAARPGRAGRHQQRLRRPLRRLLRHRARAARQRQWRSGRQQAQRGGGKVWQQGRRRAGSRLPAGLGAHAQAAAPAARAAAACRVCKSPQDAAGGSVRGRLAHKEERKGGTSGRGTRRSNLPDSGAAGQAAAAVGSSRRRKQGWQAWQSSSDRQEGRRTPGCAVCKGEQTVIVQHWRTLAQLPHRSPASALPCNAYMGGAGKHAENWRSGPVANNRAWPVQPLR